MTKNEDWMLKIILYLWQLPQNLLGLGLIAVLGAKKIYFALDDESFEFFNYNRVGRFNAMYWEYDRTNWFSRLISGVSLGQYIVLPPRNDLGEVFRHEYGHCVQSRYLGPLYIIVVGIVSVCNNIWDRCVHKKWLSDDRVKWYYTRWPENWADMLGGVKRKWTVKN